MNPLSRWLWVPQTMLIAAMLAAALVVVVAAAVPLAALLALTWGRPHRVLQQIGEVLLTAIERLCPCP